MLAADHTRPLRVLLIEDDPDDYVILRDSLTDISKNRYNLTWAATFKDGLQEVDHSHYDVCLLDYRLGAHDGLEILREAGRKGWPVPVIFLTGQGEYDVDVRAMKAGASDYLVKEEITPDLLERSIRYAVEKARAWNALQRSYEEMELRVEERTAELVETNEALKFTSEQVKVFAYAVSHDLKSPVVAIHGLARLLFERNADDLDEKGRLYCRRIMKAAEQITELADSVNVYMKARELPLRPESYRLQTIYRDLHEEFKIRLAERGVRLETCGENPVISLDRMLLMRAMRNLVENALKHAGPDLQTIKIAYRQGASFHVLSVKDDGVGINESDPERLFRMFSRAKAVSGAEGMGLGLAIVKEVAERHGGEAWVEAGNSRGLKISLSIAKDIEDAGRVEGFSHAPRTDSTP
ncbi:MAG: response regulator [Deltaproteobacteria bacterium]|nr:response regulator [Deltaproteobacteria bacterium]